MGLSLFCNYLDIVPNNFLYKLGLLQSLASLLSNLEGAPYKAYNDILGETIQCTYSWYVSIICIVQVSKGAVPC